MADRKRHLENAIKLTCGTRTEYGDTRETHNRIAMMATGLLWPKLKDGTLISAADIAQILSCLKKVRASNDPSNPDHFEDDAAYAAIAGECAAARPRDIN